MTKWLQQDCVLVRFVDDPTLLHWRCVLLPLGGDKVVVTTPDRDVEVTELKVGAKYREVKRMDGEKLPAGVRANSTYLPKHASGGKIGRSEFTRLVEQANRYKIAYHERRRLPERSAAVARASGAPAEAGQVPELAAPDESVHIIVYRSGSGGVGEEVDIPAGAAQQVLNGRTFTLFSMGGEEVLARQVPLGEVDHVQDLLRVAAPLPEETERDVRVLPVLFDAADERWRTILEATPDLEEIDYDDFPLRGPRTVYHDIRQLRRLGMDFVQHHESWLKKSGVRTTDRSVHEHSSICRVLNYMLCYDQLNLGALASAEALNRRRSLIEHAHSGRPEAPSYEAAEEMLGIRESSDGSLVDPSLLQHTAKQQAAKAEILKQSRLASEEKKHARRQGEGEDKGGKKGGGGKGAPKKEGAADP